jgi:hypothetical protein
MKVVLPVLLLAMVSRSEAQFTAGQKLLGGNFSFGTSSATGESNPPKSWGINVSPKIGFVKDKNTVYGFSLSYAVQGNKSSGLPAQEYKTRYNYANASFYVQKIKWLGEKWFIYGEGGVTGGFNNQKAFYTEDKNRKNKADGWSAGIYITPGVSYMVTKKLLLDLRLQQLLYAGFSKQTATNAESDITRFGSYKSFNASSDLNNNTLGNIGIGFRLILD